MTYYNLIESDDLRRIYDAKRKRECEHVDARFVAGFLMLAVAAYVLAVLVLLV